MRKAVLCCGAVTWVTILLLTALCSPAMDMFHNKLSPLKEAFRLFQLSDSTTTLIGTTLILRILYSLIEVILSGTIIHHHRYLLLPLPPLPLSLSTNHSVVHVSKCTKDCQITMVTS